ncbi:MAG: hypothetical protein LBG14_01770 [Treponema sp.]|jgi:hypothetical protein|nr:hypothetical protein [Treponema sp.]
MSVVEENKFLITFTNMDQGFQEGTLMYIAGKEDATKGNLGTIVLPKPADGVSIDPQLPDPVVFSYTTTTTGSNGEDVINLRVVLVKIDSDANPLRPSTCTVTVLAPAVDGAWTSLSTDIALVLSDGTTPALRNPHGLAQNGDYLYFVDYESRLIVVIGKSALEGATTSLAVQTLDLSVPVGQGGAGLDNDTAKGQAIIALGAKLYALYINADAEATEHDPGTLIRLDINSTTGMPAYSAKIAVGLNPQSIIPVVKTVDTTNTVYLLVPAIGGPQDYEGGTNGTDSNISAIEAEGTWPTTLGATAPIVVTGDDYTPPTKIAEPGSKDAPAPSTATAYDIHAIGAAMRDGSSQLFILTQVYTGDAKDAFWMLYQTSVNDFLKLLTLTGAPLTLTAATQSQEVEFEKLDEGIAQSPDPQFADAIYFWDILYEQSANPDNDEEDRLWLLLGSPFLVTKAEAYASPNTPFANPYVMFSGFGGVNVNSVDLIIETLHQAEREVSLKRGARSAKLGAASGRTASASTSMSAEEGEVEDK